ncbi:hypothetical protein MTBBW1_2710009 [Desulfamplus magnetovallimortis]|uniref:Uncharacterized protein n=1 Tax=Desulfamplus magnetovallimortis TaxID=1246637 RepID=A0A1W1HFG9_9BACT|nr:hypothetical protein MTBBW1_2710009 [Desulfamplus magnetovallimortis]
MHGIRGGAKQKNTIETKMILIYLPIEITSTDILTHISQKDASPYTAIPEALSSINRENIYIFFKFFFESFFLI